MAAACRGADRLPGPANLQELDLGGPFEDYLDAGFVDDPGGGLRLRYPRAWEARIFEVCPADVGRELARIPVPVLFLRGEASDTFLRTAARRAVRQLADARSIEIPASSHFLPFERTAEVAREIVRFAAEPHKLGALPDFLTQLSMLVGFLAAFLGFAGNVDPGFAGSHYRRCIF